MIGTTTTPSSSATIISPGMTSTLLQAIGTLTANGMILVWVWKLGVTPFSHNGKPYLIYVSRTWLLDGDGVPGRPLAMETGFWRPQPEGKIEVVLAHPTGITEIYLGEVTGTKIELATDVVASTASAKEVRGGRRLYGLVGSDLAYAYDMAAVGQSLQPHISAQLKRVSPG